VRQQILPQQIRKLFRAPAGNLPENHAGSGQAFAKDGWMRHFNLQLLLANCGRCCDKQQQHKEGTATATGHFGSP